MNIFFQTCALAALFALQGFAAAQPSPTFPSKGLKIIVPVAVGGGADQMTRIMANGLATNIGHSVVIENKGGAGGTVGMEQGARAPADGYTLTMVYQSLGPNPYLYTKLPFDTVKDFAPVTQMVNYQLVMVVNSASPYNSVADLIAAAKAKPGALTFGSSGAGGASHLAMELFQSKTGTKFVHVPYKGNAPAMTDLLGGQITVIVDALAGVAPFVQSGKVRAMGVASPNRSVLMPNVPTIGETVPGYDMRGWLGLVAPAGTPPDRITWLHKEIAATLNDPSIKARLVQTGNEIVASTPEQFSQFIRSELKSYEVIVREAGIKPGN